MNPLALKQSNGINKNDWCTPPWLFERLQEVFNFEVDGAASEENKLCDYFISENSSTAHKHPSNCRIFINPPFNDVKSFIFHRINSELLVLLVPFRPETKLWHDWFWPYAAIFVFNKRIRYICPTTRKEAKSPAFPSCLVVFGDLSKYPVNKLDNLGIFIKKWGIL